MSDEQRGRPGGGSGDEQRPLDETGQFDPFADDEDEPPRPPAADDTAFLSGDPARGLPPADPTQRIPPAGDATQQLPGAGATRPVPGADATRQMPAVEDDGGAAWAGRAEVRPPRPVPMETTTVGGWAPVADEPRRAWWMPILIGVAALLLVGLIGYGVFLITDNAGDDDPLPQASSAAPAVTKPSATRTSRTPSPTPTTASPSPEPEEVPVPQVVGLTAADARRALDEAGLTYRLRFRESDAEPGTVIETVPGEGTELEPGTTVELIVADEPRTTEPTPSPTTTGPEGD
ncbi:PASTA domain-containing protein [Spirilliplanes yamanashiensis]|uniref:PASTA domain-containing protein n=1 Tax=Spirilliplanes yamanashiensis TaxID=42233 RepID=A0A8J4DJ56_9ACTN|nr:PASTA domain-containing protein [Spirilliplanes yamanashiensis]MDP9815000.1 hypothetical protein [Spirilliplanes yamanashiensis]GIJ02655.1 hypothetical protein Sya03_20070 [Spirilliplanes yamanashiensis]